MYRLTVESRLLSLTRRHAQFSLCSTTRALHTSTSSTPAAAPTATATTTVILDRRQMQVGVRGTGAPSLVQQCQGLRRPRTWSCLVSAGAVDSLSASFSSVVASSWFASCNSPQLQQRRGVRVHSTGSSAEQGKASSDDANKQQQQEQKEQKQEGASEEKTNEEKSDEKGKEGSKKTGKKKPAEEGPTGIRGHIQGLKNDIRDFPDIYNCVNMLHFVIFTLFCLCSTGSNVEIEWWMNQWGIDASFRPWAWPLHSFLTNNFLSMSFAMLILHSMCHSVLPYIGPKGLMMYCGIIAVVSGFLIWAGNYAANYTAEKQFGPWDIVAGLFVMQALHQGFMPWQILNAFSGWVKYAMWVGAICIVYYDWQPTLTGTALGLALCKLHPRFRNVTIPGATP